MLLCFISFMISIPKKTDKWVIFNIALMFVFLLRSAGYFSPYLPISVNMIVVFALILSVVLLKANYKTMFITAMVFWIFAGLLGILKINVWAERTAIYVFESLVLGVILLTWETIFSKE